MKLKLDPKVQAIRSLPPFKGASDREIRALYAAADIVEFDRGRVICRADSRATESFVVVEGMVDVVVHGTVIATLGPGEIVGELSVLDHKPRSADVVAATDVTLLVIRAQTLLGLIATGDAVRSAVLRQLAERVRRADEALGAERP